MRWEYKYLVPLNKLGQFRSDIMPYVDYDENTLNRPDKEYTVRSIYFDNNKFNDFFEKLQGIRTRKKIRIRGYNIPNENSVVFMEIKRKAQDIIKKDRCSLFYKNLDPLFLVKDFENYLIMGENPQIVQNAQHFFYYIIKDSLKPVLLVVYEREAYFSKFDPKFRLSFDKNLRSMAYPKLDDLYSEDFLTPYQFDSFILEVKFSGTIPSWMRDIISGYHLKRISFSKYVLCLKQHKISDPEFTKRYVGATDAQMNILING